MDVSARSYLTAGVAAIGAGAIALSPVQPLDHAGLPAALASTQAVQLTAIDVITPWLDVFNSTETSKANLVNSFLGPNKSNSGDGNTIGAPLPILQQIGANQLKYLSELPNFGTIFNQVIANLKGAVKAPWSADTTTLGGLHPLVYAALPTLAPQIPQWLIDLTTTSGSGILAGIIGPVIGPVLALNQSVTDIVTAIKASNWSGAVNELLNIPAKMTNAFLNGGQLLDLTALIPVLGLPSEVKTLGLAMGGILSPGGSLFNTLDLSVQILPIGPPTTVAGVGAGPIGSLMGVGWEVASAIGWTRDGNPLKPGIPVPSAASRTATPTASAVAPNQDAAESEAGTDTATPELTAAKAGARNAAPTSSRKAGRGHSGSGNAGKSTSKRSTKAAARSAASRAG